MTEYTIRQIQVRWQEDKKSAKECFLFPPSTFNKCKTRINELNYNIPYIFFGEAILGSIYTMLLKRGIILRGGGYTHRGYTPYTTVIKVQILMKIGKNLLLGSKARSCLIAKSTVNPFSINSGLHIAISMANIVSQYSRRSQWGCLLR